MCVPVFLSVSAKEIGKEKFIDTKEERVREGDRQSEIATER